MKHQLLAFAVITTLSLQAFAVFEENARRYLSANEIIFSLQAYFPLDVRCSNVSDSNSSLLGANSAVTGNPVSPGPSQATVEYISTCLKTSFRNMRGFDPVNQDRLKILVGEEVFAFLLKSRFPVPVESSVIIEDAFSRTWSDWPEDIRNKMIANLVYVLLGSDELIEDFGLTDGPTLRNKIQTWASASSSKTAYDILTTLSVNIVLRDEFLSY